MTNEDAISRAAALDTLAFGTDGDYDTLHVYEAKDRIEALPSIPPQVVHGRWIDSGEALRHCSECGAYYFQYNYCPNCGAKMDGGEEDAVR